MCCNYYEYRLREIEEELSMYNSNPKVFKYMIDNLKAERKNILEALSYAD